MQTGTPNPWTRGLFMLLLGMCYSLAGTVLFAVALIQFVFLIAAAKPNTRLTSFGTSLGKYIGQIAKFLTFATEDKPFPFGDWP